MPELREHELIGRISVRVLDCEDWSQLCISVQFRMIRSLLAEYQMEIVINFNVRFSMFLFNFNGVSNGDCVSVQFHLTLFTFNGASNGDCVHN
ncbi:hypothetical protein Hanom_Chr06g00544061 [Helianthus anomalus]